MIENNQEVAGATEKITNPELVEKIEDKEEVIVMNDKTEVAKATVVAGGEKAPIIPEDMIGDFEEEIDEEEMEKLEKENKKILDPIGAEVREKMKIKEMEQETEESKDQEIRRLREIIYLRDEQIKQVEDKIEKNDIMLNYKIVKNIMFLLFGEKYIVKHLGHGICTIYPSGICPIALIDGQVKDIREFLEDMIRAVANIVQMPNEWY